LGGQATKSHTQSHFLPRELQPGNKGDKLEITDIHDWPIDADEAYKIQRKIGSGLITHSTFKKIEYITAVDTAFNDKINRLYAAAVTMTYENLTDIEQAVAEMDAAFPYIPSLLSFREGPVILRALSRLKKKPDLIIFAGHGIAHPLQFGLAAHLGLLLDIPSIGCARRCLSGEYEEPTPEKGSLSPLYISNIKRGFVFRTKTNVKPMFVSPGHRCAMSDAIEIISGCLGQYRMPIPLRLAHLYANKYRRFSEKKRLENGRQKSNPRRRDKITRA
jgi:deoxyribonuclease V